MQDVRITPISGRAIVFALALISAHTGAQENPATPEAIDFFEKKIRPVLVDRCVECHGPEEQSGGLRLDTVAAIRAGGDQGVPFKSADLEHSLLIKAVRYTDQNFQMPPTGKIPDAEIRLLEAWIQAGAAMPAPTEHDSAVGKPTFSIRDRKDHWAYQLISRPTPPSVNDASGVQSPIDLFLQANRQEKNLRAVGPATKSTWLRRVSFDLTGLPPAIDEIRQFDRDDRADAVDRVIDRLLASPRYGERWGRHWLDLVRFAETLGHEFDYDIYHAWRYRDYIVRAFNEDLPYRRLLVEHLAGDLLDSPRTHAITGDLESPIGTGFFWFGEATHSPVDVRQNQLDRIDNQIDVLTKAFLAQSVACARCHDHKFDAISQADYYALAGYLKSSRYDQATINSSPILTQKTKEWATRIESRDRAIDEALKKAWREKVASASRWSELPTDAIPESPGHPLYLWRALAGIEGESFATRVEQLRQRFLNRPEQNGKENPLGLLTDRRPVGWRFSGEAFIDPNLFAAHWTIDSTSGWKILPIPARGIRSNEQSLAWEGIARSPSFTIESDFIHIHAAGKGSRVNLIVDGFTIIRDPIYGGLVHRIEGEKPAWRTFDARKWIGQRAYLEFIDSTTPNPTDAAASATDQPRSNAYFFVDEILFSSSRSPSDPRPHPIIPTLLEPAPTSRENLAQRYQSLLIDGTDPVLSTELLGSVVEVGWLSSAIASDHPISDDIRNVRQFEEETIRQVGSVRRTPAMADGTGEDEFLLVRGNHRTPAQAVPRRFLEVLAGSANASSSEGSGRAELAMRLVEPGNPLTARVWVNRVWKHHLGEGIVRSPDDFGRMGQPPTHPQLLDWLASEFIDRQWSTKELHRLILSSQVCQLSSDVTEELREHDPKNESWTRANVRRLEAESVRDSILSVSGRIDLAMEGPSVMPFLTDFSPPLGRPPQAGPLDGAGRRSIYLSVRRNFLTPMLLAFDYPLPQTTIGRRNVSNVPAQALSLLNDPLVVQEANRWGQECAASQAPIPEKINTIYLQAFGRPPSSEEFERIHNFLQSSESMVNDQERWASVCHAIINAKEFIFVP
jgi:cytochrome c553